MTITPILWFVVLFSTTMMINEATGQSTCKQTPAIFHENHWYQFFDCLTTYDVAKTSCRDDMIVNGQPVEANQDTNPSLLWLDSVVESEWLEQQLNFRYGGALGIWMGARRGTRATQRTDPFFWAWNNREVRYKQFVENEPNRLYRNEDCLALIDNFHWADVECGSHLRYICKVRQSSHDRPPS